jgi:hypothetical protein
VVTYTLSLHESTACSFTANNQFTVWVTVEQATNSGLFAFGVDLTGTADAGGPTGMTVVNRTPNATFDADPSDPNYDPSNPPPTKYIGFGTGRGASGVTGVVSGVQDLAKGEDMIPLFEYGQKPIILNQSKPGPIIVQGVPVAYGNASSAANTDSVIPPLPCTATAPTPGSGRLLTGTWTGTAPSIQTTSVNTKASVWKLSHPNNTENEVATLQFVTRDLTPVLDSTGLTATPQNPNQAVGGSILVSGSNGNYASEVDQLLDPSMNKGSAVIQGIGDESGNIYVMAKLVGTAADIGAVLAALSNDVDASDSQFAALHAAYDGAFGGGGFNALFKFPNITGSKAFNWDFSTGHPNVTVDQLAAVPEPASLSLLGIGVAALLLRRRRNA